MITKNTERHNIALLFKAADTMLQFVAIVWPVLQGSYIWAFAAACAAQLVSCIANACMLPIAMRHMLRGYYEVLLMIFFCFSLLCTIVSPAWVTNVYRQFFWIEPVTWLLGFALAAFMIGVYLYVSIKELMYIDSMNYKILNNER